jgi:hypothetical protein
VVVFFGSIDHEKLMTLIGKQITDIRVLILPPPPRSPYCCGAQSLQGANVPGLGRNLQHGLAINLSGVVPASFLFRYHTAVRCTVSVAYVA